MLNQFIFVAFALFVYSFVGLGAIAPHVKAHWEEHHHDNSALYLVVMILSLVCWPLLAFVAGVFELFELIDLTKQ